MTQYERDERISDLHYIGLYAERIRNDLIEGRPVMKGYVERMLELAVRVQPSLLAGERSEP